MGKREDVLGNVYGKLTVIDDSKGILAGKKRGVLTICSCDNKTEKIVSLADLKSGHTKSCGCWKTEFNKVHGYGRKRNHHPLFDIWKGIKGRCHNKNRRYWKNYGGRGITICDEWVNDARAFIEWGLDNGWKKGLQIDRIDNDGNYEPSNCRFVTHQENSINRRLLMATNKSGYCGVSYNKVRDSWTAGITYKTKSVFYKQSFKTAKEAAIARDTFIIENDLPHPLNFPELDYRVKKEIK